jgi:hypothetical protein
MDFYGRSHGIPCSISPRSRGALILCYNPLMHSNRFWRAVVEMAFIIFLFYSNLLMGEFTRSNGRGKSLFFAIRDIFTPTNFLIAIVSAFIGYVVFECLRKMLEQEK